jgi:hypothetical protein
MQTRMYVCRGKYRSGGLRGQSCGASFYSKARNDYQLRADAETQNPFMRVESYSEVTGDYGGTPAVVFIAAHDARTSGKES